MKKHDPRNWRLCVVTDAAWARGRAHATVIRAAIEGGADVIQFRDKTLSDRAFRATARRLRAVCRAAGIPLIINDRVAIAAAVQADGVHVGQDDLSPREARRLIGPDRILGVSATTVAEARRAERDGADYVGFGPVFEARGTKPDAAAPTGTGRLRRAARSVRCPILAIGGITAGNATRVIRAGATGVAVVSAVVAARDIAAAARKVRAGTGR